MEEQNSEITFFGLTFRTVASVIKCLALIHQLKMAVPSTKSFNGKWSGMQFLINLITLFRDANDNPTIPIVHGSPHASEPLLPVPLLPLRLAGGNTVMEETPRFSSHSN
ncbi:unnamed protein product [Fraxinus pennsylvanica]|uniref:Uncharacterized protein n=1 Tax=Fraxinus pennsylvanica TaxID=56036 RepID=A0AAD1ZC24_9LAMI|nr:unnamed protein product [Fraxinus pennsylvanica]